VPSDGINGGGDELPQGARDNVQPQVVAQGWRGRHDYNDRTSCPLPSTAYDLSLLAGGDERDGEQRPGPGASRLEPHQ